MLPNPVPAAGLAGCRGIAQFWAELSGVDAAAERRARLEQFFFAGLPGFAPVVAHEHLGGTSGGSIRSFHHTSGSRLIARMYQFRLAQRCDPGCRLLVEPDTLTPTEVIRRAESQTCAGCHVVSGPVGEGVAAPPSFGFEHLSEDRVEEGQAGTRFAISPAMRDVFIPHRMQILRKFLASVQ